MHAGSPLALFPFLKIPRLALAGDWHKNSSDAGVRIDRLLVLH